MAPPAQTTARQAPVRVSPRAAPRRRRPPAPGAPPPAETQAAAALGAPPPPRGDGPRPAAAAPAEAAAPPRHPADAPPAEPDPVAAAKEKNTSRNALERGKLGDAIESGERAVALDPTDAEAWLILGAAYQEKGDQKNARRSFKSCLEQSKRGPKYECAAMPHWLGPTSSARRSPPCVDST